MSIYDERINSLRRLMREKGIAAFIIPTGDPHMSEYIPESWKLRAWYSGFTGSAGTLVVTEQQAGLWTDGRYYTQAQQQLADSKITLFRASEPDCPPPAAYVKDSLNAGDTAAVDGRTQSADTIKRLKKLFAQKQINLLDSDAAMNLWSDRQGITAKIYLPWTKVQSGAAQSKSFCSFASVLPKNRQMGYSFPAWTKPHGCSTCAAGI